MSLAGLVEETLHGRGPRIAGASESQTMLLLQAVSSFKESTPRGLKPLLGCLSPPHHGFGLAPGDSPAAHVHEPKIILRVCVALLGSLSPPFYRLGRVRRNPEPMRVEEPKAVLSLHVSLLCRFAPPVYRGSRTLLYSLPIRIQHA